MALSDVYEDQFFSNTTIIANANIFSLLYYTITFNDIEITVTPNILETVNVVTNYNGVAGQILFEGAYSGIFTDRFVQYRATGGDPTVYTVQNFALVPNDLYALTRYRPDNRNELNVIYTFSAEVNDPETGIPANANVVASQFVLNNYEIGIQQMLQKLANETKTPGQV